MKYITRERITFWSWMLVAAIVGSFAGRAIDILALVVRLVTKPSLGDVAVVGAMVAAPFVAPLLLGHSGSLLKALMRRALGRKAEGGAA